ncbi:MAG: hypothetical protein JO212_09990 [Acetobacteraceae bacterium]|nr:hypothetical protein [Acetobacteraceae bacterium]
MPAGPIRQCRKGGVALGKYANRRLMLFWLLTFAPVPGIVKLSGLQQLKSLQPIVL